VTDLRAGNERAASPPSRTGAGAAGMGAGTFLVVIANQLQPTSPWKAWLLIAAPTVSVLGSAAWWWLQVRIMTAWQDRQFKRFVEEARSTFSRQLEEPGLAEHEQKRITELMQRLRELESDRYLAKIKSVSVLPSERSVTRGKTRKASG
jgi:hypothetical protein